MGHVYAEIELINNEDVALARRNVIGPEEVKRMTVKALVDTGAIMMCINESIQELIVNPDHPYFAQLKIKSYKRA